MHYFNVFLKQSCLTAAFVVKNYITYDAWTEDSTNQSHSQQITPKERLCMQLCNRVRLPTLFKYLMNSFSFFTIVLNWIMSFAVLQGTVVLSLTNANKDTVLYFYILGRLYTFLLQIKVYVVIHVIAVWLFTL